jgi:hypothetical protein
VKQSTDTDRESVPVIPEEVNMSDEINYIWCRECGNLVHYTSENTTIVFFPDYPWYSFAQTECGHCNYKQALFLTNNLEWELAWAIKHDLGFITLDGFPPEQVMESFDEVYPEFVHYHLLSESEENQVLFFGYLLENTDPKEWFNE